MTIPPFSSIDIRRLLPQQPPFVMVDSLLSWNEKETVCHLTIREDNIFYNNGLFDSCGIMENIAQTCAARLGFVNKYILGKDKVQVGFIGAVSGFKLLRNPVAGEEIVTTVEIIDDVMGMTLAKGYVRSGEELVAETSIKIALGEQML